MVVFIGTPRDALVMLQAHEAAGRRVRRVLLGLDLFMFADAGVDRPGLDARHHPAATGESWAGFWLAHLFGSSTYLVLKLGQAMQAVPSIAFDVDTGRYALPAWDAAITADPEGFFRQHEVPESTIPGQEVRWIESHSAELKALLRWLQERRVGAIVFLHPHLTE